MVACGLNAQTSVVGTSVSGVVLDQTDSGVVGARITLKLGETEAGVTAADSGLTGFNRVTIRC